MQIKEKAIEFLAGLSFYLLEYEIKNNNVVIIAANYSRDAKSRMSSDVLFMLYIQKKHHRHNLE